MIDRYLLRYFLAVIDEGNFSRAAARCNVSQPTLSVGIAKLEALLHRPLFHRTNRRVELTEAGARLSVYARRIEADFLMAERDAQSAAVKRTLRVGLLTTFPASWIAEAIGKLGRTAERIELTEGRERELLGRLDRGRIDLAITIVKPDSRFEQQPIFSDPYRLALSRSHALAGRELVAAEELVHEAMVLRRHCELLGETSRHFTERGVRPFFSARTTDDQRALCYVAAGLGVTVIPRSLACPDIATPRLADFPRRREIGMHFSPSSDASEHRRRWPIDELAERIRVRGTEMGQA